MENFNIDSLKNLMEMDSNGLVSIYMPTYKMGKEVTQSRIILKNLLKEAESKLIESGFGQRDVDKQLKPANKLVDDTIFWQNQESGLGIFISPQEFKYFKIPLEMKEIVSVSNRYYLKPLIKVLNSEFALNVLTLSQAQVKLYEVGRNSIDEIKVPEIEELVENYIPAKDLHQEATSPKGAAAGMGSYMHGYNEMSQTEKNEISKHLRSIDKEVNRVLKDSKNQLLIHSVDYIYPMYKEVSGYPKLMDESIKGSPEGIHVKDIHSKALEIYLPKYESNLEHEIERYKTLRATDSKLANENLEYIVKAAYMGNVDRLFIADDIEQWGSYKIDENKVVIDNKEGLGQRDLLDYAAILTMANGGKVYVIDKDNLPGLKPIGAILRF